jgi:hypothetical protein
MFNALLYSTVNRFCAFLFDYTVWARIVPKTNFIIQIYFVMQTYFVMQQTYFVLKAYFAIHSCFELASVNKYVKTIGNRIAFKNT